jgi:putative ABC transport system permease protein
MSLASFAQDLRHTLRAAARTPGTAAVLLLSLALGTGANAAVYGVMTGLLLAAPAGVHDPSRLVNIFTSEFSGATYGPSSYADYLSVASETSAFAAVAAIDDRAVENVTIGAASAAARIAAVSDSFFPVLNMKAQSGILPPALAASSDAAAVVSFPLAEQLGGTASVVGQLLTIAGQSYTVVGVTPPRFRGLQIGRECDVWIPLAPLPPLRGDRRLAIVARLAPEARLRSAEDALRRLSSDLAERYPQTNRGNKDQPDAPRRITPVRYSPLDPSAGDQIRLIAIVIGGASALLLTSACLNVGSLLLSAALARRGELAIKMALGASRERLVRQLLTEALFLSLVGGALGLLFALWTSTAIPALFMVEQAEQLDTGLDASAMLLTVGLATLAGVLFAIAPALQGTSAPAVTALRADAGGVSAPRGGSLRAWLVGGQVALSTALLLATGLAVSSLAQALDAGFGSTTKRVAFVSVELPGKFHDSVSGITYRNALIEKLSSLAGVEAVGWASKLPVSRASKQQFRLEGDSAGVTDTVELETNVVNAEYFRALVLQCVEGRLFEAGDGVRAPPVAVVDELLAQRYFGKTAVGGHLIDVKDTRLEIVGVVRTARYRTLQQAPQPTVYYPSSQEYLYQGHAIIRASADSATLLRSLDGAVSQAGPGGTLRQISTLDAYLADALSVDRLITTLIGVCGLIALAMSAVGIYGVMTDTVRRRTREIGLRVALGARPLQIGRLVFGESMRLASLGLLGGLTGALAVTSIARMLLYGVPPLNLPTLSAVVAALAVVIGLAAIVPLGRALRVSPMVALRDE